MPGCNCCGTTADCPAESITVSLVDLPNENRVGGVGGAVYDADNYMTSNEGDFTLEKTADFPSGSTHVCVYDYNDAGDGYTFLKINVRLTHYHAASTPYWRVKVTVDADGGQLAWQKDTTAAVLPTTLTNTNVTVNTSGEYGPGYYPWYPVPLPWTLQPTMTATVQAVTPGSLPQCQPTCTQWFPATPGTCKQIMGVAAATDRPGYCGESPTIFSVAPVGTPDRTLSFVNAGTDTLDLTLQDWTGNRGSGTAVTVAFGGATHSLGWGGRDCLDLLEGYEAGTSTSCTSGSTGPGGYRMGRRDGWIGAFNVVATFDSSGSGGSVTNYNCVALVSARLSRVYPLAYNALSAIAATRRIVFEIALYRYHGFEPAGNRLTQLNETHYAFTSDGTISEDAYTYGSFPTFTQANVATAAKLCFFAWPSVITWSSRDFTLEQG